MKTTKGTNKSRREFLAKAGLASASLPFLPLLRFSEAQAASQLAPLRLILVRSEFQIPEIFFHPQLSPTNSAMAPAGPLANYNLGFSNSVLAPLAPFQSDLILFRGLQYGQALSSHNSFPGTFTGFSLANPTTTGIDANINHGSSIDYYLFSRMGQKGALTPPAVTHGPFQYGPSSYCVSWNNGTPVSQVANPMSLYTTLFGNFSAPTTGTLAAASAATRRQQSLAFVQTHLQKLAGRVPAASSSHTALQTHLSAAQGLSGQIGNSTTPPPNCSPPAQSSINNDPAPESFPNVITPSNVAPDFASFTKLVVQGLACDISRFWSFKMSDTAGIWPVIPGLGYTGSDFHADITHSTTGAANDPATITMAIYKKYFMAQTANLLTALKSVQDPFNPAQTLYDNSIVLIGSEGPFISVNGSDVHANASAGSDQPFIIAGGCGGYFKKGQLIIAGGSTTRNTNHNALLTNIINTFEKNQQQFNPAFVPKILTQYGDYPFSVSPTSWLA